MDALTSDAIPGTRHRLPNQSVAARDPAAGAQQAETGPGYMTPTACSRAQFSHSETRIPPPPATVITGKRKTWMASAAKRVGIAPSTPRSKKEGRVYKRASPRRGTTGKTGEASPHQDQPTTRSANLQAPDPTRRPSFCQESGHSTFESSAHFHADGVFQAASLEKRSLAEKPLPSLPIATVQSGSPVVRRSLIDASENPLRSSSSPSIRGNVEEEWPVLFHSRPTTPRTIQYVVGDGSLKQSRLWPDNAVDGKSEFLRSDQCQVVVDQDADAAPTHTNPASVSDTNHIQGGTHDPQPKHIGPIHGVNSGNDCIQYEPQYIQSARHSSVDASNAERSDLSAGAEAVSHQGSMMQQGPHSLINPPSVRANRINARTLPAKHNMDPWRKSTVRPSRLPRKRAVTGPIRSSSGPRRPGHEIKSPYTSIPAPLSWGPATEKARFSRKDDRSAIPDQATSTSEPASVASQHRSSGTIPTQSSSSARTRQSRSSIAHPAQQIFTNRHSERNNTWMSKLPTKPYIHSPTDDYDTKEDRKSSKEAESETVTSTDLVNHSAICDDTPQSLNLRAPFELQAPDVITGEAFDPAYRGQIKRPGSNYEPYPTAGDSQENAIHGINGNLLANPYFDTARQRQIIDKPSNHVKKTMASAPQQGPLLRISDAAENITIGCRSDADVNEQYPLARQRNSVPDLRRTIGMKELCRSKDAVMDDSPSLSKGSTTRSLNTLASKTAANAVATWKILHGPTLQSCPFRQIGSSCSKDPLTVPERKAITTAKADSIFSPNSDTSGHQDDGWPLQLSRPTAGGLCSVEEEVAEGMNPSISPLPDACAELSAEEKSTLSVSLCRGNSAEPRDIARPADTSMQSQDDQHMYSPYINSETVNRETPLALPIGTVSTGSSTGRFPPRTSSKSFTPENTHLTRQINAKFSSSIPNRFETTRQRKLLGESPVPVDLNIRPETVCRSAQKLDVTGVATPSGEPISKTHRSSAKGVLCNIKGLFHKRGTTNLAPAPAKARPTASTGRSTIVGFNGSPYPSRVSIVLPVKSPPKKSIHRGGQQAPRPSQDEHLSSPPQDSDLLCHATDLAIQYLDAARVELDEMKRARLLQLGEFMVEAVSGARDAEKAMEEAQQAAAKAEIHSIRARQNIVQMTRMIGEISESDVPRS